MILGTLQEHLGVCKLPCMQLSILATSAAFLTFLALKVENMETWQ